MTRRDADDAATGLRRRRPASLRGRVVLGVLVLLLVLLAALFTTVDALLTARLHADLRTRLTDRVALAEQLDGALSPQQLVNRLKGDGVAAQLCSPTSSNSNGSSGSSSSSASNGSSASNARCVIADTAPGGPGAVTPGQVTALPGPAGGPAKPGKVSPTSTGVEQSGQVLFVRTTLPSTGQILTLSVDSSQVGSTVRGLIALEVIGGLVALLLAALLLGRVVATALRPLDDMTALAASIAGGDRGRRLRSGRPDTELGRTAVAFDAMLDELESALAAAAAAELRLRSFLSDVSHELRTPLTGLAATTETLLRDEPERADRERAYVTLVRETRRAGRLVDDLLTVTRLDTGMSLDAERIDLAEIAAQETERVATLSPELDVRLDAHGPAIVQGDPIRLGQIIGNLLNNARTAAGPTGHVLVRVDADPLWWHVDVTDSGPGVEPADRERIFERLVRLDASRSREGGGFGLGLAIARMLARAHGGELAYVAHAGDVGARFRLSLPRPPA